MTQHNKGGPAFPNEVAIKTEQRSGMTLRDYFAAKAMQGELCAQSPATGEYNNLDALAVLSYRIADAMLKAREQ